SLSRRARPIPASRPRAAPRSPSPMGSTASRARRRAPTRGTSPPTCRRRRTARARQGRASMQRRGICALTVALALGCAAPASPAAAPAARKYEAPDERFVFFAAGKTDLLPEGYFAIGYV